MKNRRNWWAALLSVGIVIAVGLAMLSSTRVAPLAPTGEETEPSRERVQRSAMRAATWRFVYCLQDGAAGQELVAMLHEIAKAQPFGKRIEVISCQDLSADSLGAGPLTIFGDQLPDHPLPAILESVGNDWVLAGRLSIASNDVLYLPYSRNPWSEEPTVTGYYLSANLEQLVKLFRRDYSSEWGRMFWPNWAYELHQGNGDRVYGSYLPRTWEFDLAGEISLKSPDVPVYDREGLRVFAYDGTVAPASLDLTVTGVLEVKQLLDELLGTSLAYHPEIRIYPTLERIGLRLGRMAPIQYDAKAGVLHIVPGFIDRKALLRSALVWQPYVETMAGGSFPDHNLEVVVAALQTQVSGAEKSYFLQADLEASKIWAAGLIAGPEDWERENPSEPILEAIARVQARSLDLSTPEKANAALKTWRTKPLPKRKFGRPPVAGNLPSVAHRPSPTQRLAGMTFAHEGYRVHDGYGGEKIKPSLDSLVGLNVNALAIVPYTFMRDPNKPIKLFIPADAGSENDWATICSAREAKARGMFVLLKPQIWLGGGHWPGDVDFATEAEWDAFFASYTYWIMHYALLAEREKIGALCLGTELVKTTLKHPDRWREVIRKVRTVYGGQLTYAANWGEEFEGFTFWDDLDVIGLNSYYPISEKDDPTDAELLEGARRWMKMAAAVSRSENRPLWLTEVGYRSTARAWQNPHADAGDRPTDVEAQDRCFDALLTAAEETPELRGMFIWKWPSYLGRNSYRKPGSGFTPGGKPAAVRMQAHYDEWGK